MQHLELVVRELRALVVILIWILFTIRLWVEQLFLIVAHGQHPYYGMLISFRYFLSQSLHSVLEN